MKQRKHQVEKPQKEGQLCKPHLDWCYLEFNVRPESTLPFFPCASTALKFPDNRGHKMSDLNMAHKLRPPGNDSAIELSVESEICHFPLYYLLFSMETIVPEQQMLILHPSPHYHKYYSKYHIQVMFLSNLRETMASNYNTNKNHQITV